LPRFLEWRDKFNLIRFFSFKLNRPDLLSLEGFARSFKKFIGKDLKISEFKVEKPLKDYVVEIDSSVKSVRPHTVCAIVKNLKLNDSKIKDLIDIQEKLHLTIGRKRKKLAIGIYPLDKIKLPIKFEAKKPDQIKFIPLEMNKELTGAQILRQHPAGRDYADLLKGADKYPIFTDAYKNVLSMPPIINSHETGKIDEKTKEVFIECSGFNLDYLKMTLNIIVSAFANMGGKVYSMKVIDKKGGDFVSPDLSFEKVEFKIEDIEKTIGIKLKEKDVKNNLLKMGIGLEKKGNKLLALVPPYRIDILHWVDIAEEVAIAYGYDNFEPEIPEISTIAQEDDLAVKKRTLGNLFAGLGLLEVSSYHLSTKKNIKKAHFDFNEFIEVEDSKTEYTVLRNDLFSNLLKVLSENSNSSYPQKIFEMGRVFEKDVNSETGVSEKENLAIAICDESANFTELKQILDYFFRMIGKEYSISEVEEDSNYITGRVGDIVVSGSVVGRIGEVAPRVLKNWKIGLPVSALELDLMRLM